MNHCLDVEPLLDQGIPHQKSNKRYVLEKDKFEANHRMYEFGLNGQEVKHSDYEYFMEKNPMGGIIWMKDIRKTEQVHEAASTQAGQRFYELVNSLNNDDKVDQIYVSFNLENVHGAIGVSTNCLNGGLTTEEAIDVCLIAGLYSNKIFAFDINEYNPFVEDWRTGRLVATMFYYFTLGMSKRL